MKKNILIVNDDFDYSNVLKRVLEHEGYGVYIAQNEGETFDALSRKPIDLILMDLQPGDTRGFEICRKLKSDDTLLSSIPIICISILQLEEDLIKAFEYGFTDFITKPFTNRLLAEKIRSVLRFKEEEERLKKSREELIELITITSKQKELLSQEAEFSRDLNQVLDAESKKSFIRERLPTFLGAELFTIFLIDENERVFKLFVSNHPDIPPNLIVPIDSESIMHEVLRTRNYLFLKDFSKSGYRRSSREKYTTDIVCSVPLISGHRTIGVLNVNDPGYTEPESFDFEGRIVRTSRHLAVSLHNTILYEKVKDFSKRDSMTGLYNYGHFLETLKGTVKRVKRQKEPLACIMVDIDDFKLVNDTYGHQVGDLVLKALARSVSISVRSSDIPARYGGDEFVIVLPKTDKRLAHKMAKRLVRVFSSREIKMPDGSMAMKVTISIGIAGLPEDTKDMNELMKMADEALYQAKREGKNRIIEYGKTPQSGT